MRRFKTILAMVLVVAMIMSLAILPASAESFVEVDNQADFISNLKDGKSVKLDANIAIDDPIVLKSGDMTIDMNGRSILVDVSSSVNTNELSFSDNAVKTAYLDSLDDHTPAIVVDGANLTITNQSSTIYMYKDDSSVFDVIEGSLTMDGCSVKPATTITDDLKTATVFNAFGGTTKCDKVSVGKIGGFFNAFGKANVELDHSTITNSYYGFTANDNSNITLTSSNTSNRLFICKVNDNATVNTKLSSFVIDGSAIPDPLYKEGVILNGGTVNLNSSKVTANLLGIFCIENRGAKLTIDGKDTSWTVTDNNDVLLTDGGSTTINNCHIVTHNGCVLFCRSGDVTINDCFMKSNHGTTVYIQESEPTDKINVTINGGTFESVDDNALEIDGGNLTINNGKFNTKANNTIRIDNQGNYHENNKFIINGGTFTSGTGSNTYGSNHAALISTTFERNKNLAPGDYGYYYHLPLIINDGTFTSSLNAALNLSGDTTINGGEFTGLCVAAIFNNTEYISDAVPLTYNVKGGHFTAIEDTDNESPDDDIKGMHTAVLFREKDLANKGVFTVLSDGYKYFTSDGIITKETTKTPDMDFAKLYLLSATDVVVENATPKITTGANAEIEYQNAKDTLFKSEAAYKWFFNGDKIIGEVLVDGVKLDPSNYTHKAGSTDITLKASYLNTLSLGKHTIQIVSNVLGNKVIAETTFTIVEEEEIAQTSDTTTIALFAAASTLSAAAFITLKKKEY